tara:strand:- start:1279 stop:1851 length:573 start_codon:yes stop_codon:yes gene_type:complete
VSNQKNQKICIAGIDYSMTCPCICIYSGNKRKFDPKACRFHYLIDKNKYSEKFETNIFGDKYFEWETDIQRYDSIADWAIGKVAKCEQVAIEGYAFAAKGRVFNIAENTGILKYKLYQIPIPVSVFTPTEIKKKWSGKGNANKEEIVRQFRLDTGLNLKQIFNTKQAISPLSDIADSYFVCRELFEQINY